MRRVSRKKANDLWYKEWLKGLPWGVPDFHPHTDRCGRITMVNEYLGVYYTDLYDEEEREIQREFRC